MTSTIDLTLSAALSPEALEAGIRAYNEDSSRAVVNDAVGDAVFERLSDSGQRLFEQVEALPNTGEHLRLRALAIGAACDNTDDLANLDLGELGAHAHDVAGRMVRQVLACVADNAPAPAPVGHDAHWATLVQDYQTKRTAWLRTVDMTDKADTAFHEAAKALPPKPVAPEAAFSKEWSLTQIVAAANDPSHKAAFAAYQREQEAWQAGYDALSGEMRSAADVAYKEAFGVEATAFNALLAYRATSHAVLAEKIGLIMSHHDGFDIEAEQLAAILADVQHLAARAS